MPLPRILVTRPREGCLHPAGATNILEFLRTFEEENIYGLREISLARAEMNTIASSRFILGTLHVPGKIILYEQAMPPWTLIGRLSESDEDRLTRAGAVVEMLGLGNQTLVHWPNTTLRDFMLFDVLVHEMAHHVIQQYKGKRSSRVFRTADHEALAQMFVLQRHKVCARQRGK